MFAPAGESRTFLQLTALCQDRTLVGMKLLDKISSVPHGELSCSKFTGHFLTCLGPKEVSKKSPGISLSNSVWILVPALYPYPSSMVYKFLVESHPFVEENLENIGGKASQNIKSHKQVTF